MGILVTGGTGYIGSYVLAGLLARGDEPLFVLAREATTDRLWRALQLHLDADRFRDALDRVRLVQGDITRERLGATPEDYARLVQETTSVLHIAASLNRKSERQCLAVNLKGTLEVIRFAQRAHADHGLRRFGHVSTVAVAGKRQDETVLEDRAIDWERPDYDPYARTKKFCEHMVGELLPDVPQTIYRPSVVLGDSRRPETTQFDMVRAFAFLARRRVLPLRPDDRIDIVPADYVGEAIVALHLDPAPRHRIYHLSAGEDSLSYRTITRALADAGDTPRPRFWPWLQGPFAAATRRLARLRRRKVGRAASALEVFLPYLLFNTVFDNRRVVEALGRRPEPFTDYAHPLLRWSLEHRFRYPYREPPA